MSELTKIEEWFKTRPKWQQEAIRLLCEYDNLTKEQSDKLYIQFIEEMVDGKIIDTKPLPVGLLYSEPIKIPIKLISISNPKGINRLNPKKPLAFGDMPICVIYGENGVGKSGYVRILKKLSNSIKKIQILSDVYAEGESPNQECDISIMINDEEINYHCNLNEEVGFEGINTIDVFDSEVSDSYIREKRESNFEPPILVKFSELNDICTNFTERLVAKLCELQIEKLTIPEEIKLTQTALQYLNLTHETNIDEFESLNFWDIDQDCRLKELTTLIQEVDPQSKIDQLKTVIEHKSKLIQILKSLCNSICPEVQQRIIDKTNIFEEKHKILSDSKKILSTEYEFSIDSPTWKALWAAAKNYSEEVAYKGITFPNTGVNAKCPLCQQTLSDDACNRFKKLNDFVLNRFSLEEQHAKSELGKEISTLTTLIDIDKVIVLCESCNLEEFLKIDILTYLKKINEYIKEISDNGFARDIHKFDCPTNCILSISKSMQKIDENIKSYQNLINEEKKTKLINEQLELMGKRWAKEHIVQIKKEHDKLVLQNKYEKAKILNSTRAITDKKKALSKEIITNAYTQRFNDELRHLGIRNINVTCVSKGDSGKVLNSLILSKVKKSANKPYLVLSEGESKIISLAAFLADSLGRDVLSPFIFDDPISSLDIKYEQAVIKRLIELSKKRQVIVFTHRLSLVKGLEDFAKHKEIGMQTIEICKQPWGDGDIRDFSLSGNVKTKLKILLNNWINSTEKELIISGYSEKYSRDMRSICTEFRKCIEDLVSDILLKGIVKRFDPAIHTGNKLVQLADIESEECLKIEELMTKYSFSEHSQSDERVQINFSIDDPDFSINNIKLDIKTVIEMIDIIIKRRK